MTSWCLTKRIGSRIRQLVEHKKKLSKGLKPIAKSYLKQNQGRTNKIFSRIKSHLFYPVKKIFLEYDITDGLANEIWRCKIKKKNLYSCKKAIHVNNVDIHKTLISNEFVYG